MRYPLATLAWLACLAVAAVFAFRQVDVAGLPCGTALNAINSNSQSCSDAANGDIAGAAILFLFAWPAYFLIRSWERNRTSTPGPASPASRRSTAPLVMAVVVVALVLALGFGA